MYSAALREVLSVVLLVRKHLQQCRSHAEGRSGVTRRRIGQNMQSVECIENRPIHEQ